MKRFVSTMIVAALTAVLAAGCGDDKKEEAAAGAKPAAPDAGQLVFVDWGGTNTDARIKGYDKKSIMLSFGCKASVYRGETAKFFT